MSTIEVAESATAFADAVPSLGGALGIVERLAAASTYILGSSISSAKLAALKSRFEEYYIPEPNSGCWLWIGGTVPDGYGSFYWGEDGRYSLKAHRASWILHRAPLPELVQVLHRCDMRSCVNPDHLFLGDNTLNVSDRVCKGRSAVAIGSINAHAILDEATAERVLHDPRTHAEIAAELGTSTVPVLTIKTGRNWLHVTKGRTDRRGPRRGEQSSTAKLTEAAVRSIRADARPHTEIAHEYGVSATLIYRVKQRKGWAHVN